MGKFILYNYFRSSASYRVRIALNLKNIAYEYRAVHLLNGGGEQFSEEYRKLNPSREVPTLIHDGKAIGQSMAIIDYLDRVSPNPRLFPEDPFQRAQVMQACEIINSGAQPVHNLRVLGQLGERFGADQTAKNEWTKYWITYGLQSLEDLIRPHAGKFCFGDQPSAADCFAMPHFANADRFEVSMSAYPTLSRVRTSCEALEAIKKAAPSVQPDTPKN
ncbi:MAG TPA: maleylacetoacetate isomerase [Bdellovibrionales bacterium]|jgi:maleylacetoacetate isomerase|nr:maleylacetoacetate isomerase [Bdellovibrionales bacterium]